MNILTSEEIQTMNVYKGIYTNLLKVLMAFERCIKFKTSRRQKLSMEKYIQESRAIYQELLEYGIDTANDFIKYIKKKLFYITVKSIKYKIYDDNFEDTINIYEGIIEMIKNLLYYRSNDIISPTLRSIRRECLNEIHKCETIVAS